MAGATKYHIAPQGPMFCEAEIRECPYAQAGGKHYGTFDKAQQVWHEQMVEKFGELDTQGTNPEQHRKAAEAMVDILERDHDFQKRMIQYRNREAVIASLKKKIAEGRDQEALRQMNAIHNMPPVPPPPGNLDLSSPPPPPAQQGRSQDTTAEQAPGTPPTHTEGSPSETQPETLPLPDHALTPDGHPLPPPPPPGNQMPPQQEHLAEQPPRIPVMVGDGAGVGRKPPLRERFRGMFKGIRIAAMGRVRRLGNSQGDRLSRRQASMMSDARARRPLTPAQVRRQRRMDAFARGAAQKAVAAEKAIKDAYNAPGKTVYKRPAAVQIGDVDLRYGKVVGVIQQSFGNRVIQFQRGDDSTVALRLNHDHTLHIQGESKRERVERSPIFRGAKRAYKEVHWILTAPPPRYDKYDEAWRNTSSSRAHQQNGRRSVAHES